MSVRNIFENWFCNLYYCNQKSPRLHEKLIEKQKPSETLPFEIQFWIFSVNSPRSKRGDYDYQL